MIYAATFEDFVGTFQAAPTLQTQSGRADSNCRPLVPQTSALTRLRHAHVCPTRYRSCFSHKGRGRRGFRPAALGPLAVSGLFLPDL